MCATSPTPSYKKTAGAPHPGRPTSTTPLGAVVSSTTGVRLPPAGDQKGTYFLRQVRLELLKRLIERLESPAWREVLGLESRKRLTIVAHKLAAQVTAGLPDAGVAAA